MTSAHATTWSPSTARPCSAPWASSRGWKFLWRAARRLRPSTREPPSSVSPQMQWSMWVRPGRTSSRLWMPVHANKKPLATINLPLVLITNTSPRNALLCGCVPLRSLSNTMSFAAGWWWTRVQGELRSWGTDTKSETGRVWGDRNSHSPPYPYTQTLSLLLRVSGVEFDRSRTDRPAVTKTRQ